MNEWLEVAFSEQEVDALVVALAESREDTGFTEEEARLLLEWAARARFNSVLLGLALKGAVGVDVREGEIVFTGRGEILSIGPV